MSGEPEIIASWQQANVNTRQEVAREKQRRKTALHTAKEEAIERALPQRSIASQQEIGFYAEKEGAGIGPITVIAGEGAPTVTGGFVKVAKVQRFQRVSITTAEGYDPVVLSVPILFDAVALTKDRPNVERQITILEEMAGRPMGGTLGAPPQVEVFTANSKGVRTNLIPRKFQEDPELLWYITGITWDPNPLRDRGGERLRQAATVELTEIILNPGALESASKVQRKIAAKRPSVFVTTDVTDTIKKVAIALAAKFRNKQLATRWNILAKANTKLGTSSEKHLKPGTKVKIPPDFWNKVPRGPGNPVDVNGSFKA